jgi:choline dehydrogenase-like flavoprotein
VDGKSDSDLRCVRPVVKTGNVELLTNTQVMRLKTDPSGRRVVSAICKGSDDNEFKVVGDMFVLCAGAVNSAVILLNSRSSVHPDGLANGSGMIGRNLMFHNASALLAIDPFRSFTKHYLKTVAVNDFYLNDPRDPDYQYPLGNFQLLGNVTSGMLKAVQPLAPKMVTDYLDRHSLPFYASTEDVPVDGNRLQVSPDGRINIHYRKTNATSHNRLLRYVRQALRRLGFTFILVRAAGPDTLGHQCGTIRMGKDPASSVVDSTGKAHELENLYVADSSVFPSSSALNPGLTVMACALRTANYISDRLS